MTIALAPLSLNDRFSTIVLATVVLSMIVLSTIKA